MPGLSSLSSDKKSEIYVITIQILFSIIIGISLTDYHKELVPFEFNFETLMIATAFAAVLVSLVGYSITIQIRHHKNITRFIVDLFLLFLYYQLVYSPLNNFKYFLQIFPLIFGAYLVWQILEYIEWRGQEGYADDKFIITFFGTVVFFIAFLLLAIFYNGTAIVEDNPSKKLHYLLVGEIEYTAIFIILSLLVTFRIFIWKVN